MAKYWFAKHPEGKLLQGSVVWDASNMPDGDEEAKEVTCTGAALGDFVLASLSIDLADLTLSAAVTAADTITCVISNNTGGAINLAEATVYVLVIPKATYSS